MYNRRTAMSIFEDVFRLVDRDIWIVTAAAGTRRGGMVATWVSQSSISAERPVVVLGAAPNHFTTELIEKSGRFALHLLHEEQTAVALNFAIGSGRDRDKFDGVQLQSRDEARRDVRDEARGNSQAPPLLATCLAWLDCHVFAHLETGDRTYYWANAPAGAVHAAAPPLRQNALIAAATAEQREALKQNRIEDAALGEPRHDAWRHALPVLLRPGG